MNLRYPFLFRVLGSEGDGPSRYFVKIADPFDYTHYDSAWMDDGDLPADRTLVPDVDICVEKHEFETESEAYAFIKNWWAQQD